MPSIYLFPALSLRPFGALFLMAGFFDFVKLSNGQEAQGASRGLRRGQAHRGAGRPRQATCMHTRFIFLKRDFLIERISNQSLDSLQRARGDNYDLKEIVETFPRKHYEQLWSALQVHVSAIVEGSTFIKPEANDEQQPQPAKTTKAKAKPAAKRGRGRSKKKDDEEEDEMDVDDEVEEVDDEDEEEEEEKPKKRSTRAKKGSEDKTAETALEYLRAVALLASLFIASKDRIAPDSLFNSVALLHGAYHSQHTRPTRTYHDTRPTARARVLIWLLYNRHTARGVGDQGRRARPAAAQRDRPAMRDVVEAGPYAEGGARPADHLLPRPSGCSFSCLASMALPNLQHIPTCRVCRVLCRGTWFRPWRKGPRQPPSRDSTTSGARFSCWTFRTTGTTSQRSRNRSM